MTMYSGNVATGNQIPALMGRPALLAGQLQAYCVSLQVCNNEVGASGAGGQLYTQPCQA